MTLTRASSREVPTSSSRTIEPELRFAVEVMRTRLRKLLSASSCSSRISDSISVGVAPGHVVDTDTDIQLIGPSYSSILYGTGFSYVALEANEYNVFVTEPGTKSVIAGPLSIDLEKSHNYSLVITDSPNISAADLLFFEDSAL